MKKKTIICNISVNSAQIQKEDSISPPPRGKIIRRKSKSEKAGLVFPISRVKRHLKRLILKQRIAFNAATYLTAVLEYLVAELLFVAGEAAHDNDFKRISPRSIFLAEILDSDLMHLFKSVVIPGGGALPMIVYIRSEKLKLRSREEASKKHKISNLNSPYICKPETETQKHSF